MKKELRQNIWENLYLKKYLNIKFSTTINLKLLSKPDSKIIQKNNKSQK